MNDSIKNLEQLVDAIESAGANIAPSYLEYMPLAFAIANDCGEAGRTLFHRICRQSEKYDHADAEKMYSNAIQKSNGKNTLGTVWHLAEMAGVNMKKLSFTPSLPSHVHDTYNAPKKSDATGNGTPEPSSAAETNETALPPTFPEYRWPRFLQQAIDCGESQAQRDILLLGAITVLGATLNKLVCFNYGHKDHYPCLQTFVLALPASGKGALTWTRQLAEPIHDEMLSAYLQKMKVYRQEKTKWDYMGKERTKYPEPELPKMNLFFIAGDNSGTGMQENLMDNEGAGMICESEADTVSTAIGTDYGHWSHTLRKAFDHDRLSYNRRTNHEYRECTQLQLSVLLSGTPAQLCPLIPSPENGLFSRQLFYYMPAIQEWVNQFNLTGEDYSRLFRQWGEQWKTVLNAIKAEASGFRLQLSTGQQEEFNSRMAQIFSHAGIAHGSHMRSTVARIAINVCRMMCVVALMRSLEDLLPADSSMDRTDLPKEENGEHPQPSMTKKLLACPGLAPCTDTPRENITDGMVPSFNLTITPEDFETVLNLVEPLYRHSCYVLMFLPNTEVEKRQPSPREVFLSSLPMKFTRKEAMEIAHRNDISESTFDTLLKRMTDKGVIECTGRGQYQFSSRIRVKGEGA
ncbi:DUF3987 domain-containing protein [Phocaeicola sp.]